MSGEVGRIQGGPWRVRLAVVARVRLVSDGGLVSFERARGAIGGLLAVFGFGLVTVRWFRVVPGMFGCRFSVRWLVVYVHAALVLLALRALPCVVLRCLAFVLCVPVGMS